MPDERATERQRKYAKSLGLSFPPDIMKYAMSDMISKKVNEDSDPDQGLIDFARSRGVEFSPYIGKRALYYRLFAHLPPEGKAQYFVFSVYRWFSGDREENLERSRHRDAIFEIADLLAKNARALKSLSRYHGEQLQAFGTASRDGWRVPVGGSAQTIAYKEARRLLDERSLIPVGGRPAGTAVEPDAHDSESPEMSPIFTRWMLIAIGVPVGACLLIGLVLKAVGIR